MRMIPAKQVELKKFTEIAKRSHMLPMLQLSHDLRGGCTYLLRTVPFPAQ